MRIILPVESAQSEDPITMAPVDVRRVTVQITESEAQAIVGGDAATEAALVSTVGGALADAGVTP